MRQQVILLNGPSSSGKSTLSKALQSLISDEGHRYEVVSIDDFMKISKTETIYEDDVFEISGKMCQKALELLEAGNGVIIDHVITSERIFEELKEALSSYSIKTVHITCPLNILRNREIERGDRCLGSAEASAEYLYPKEGYDLTVDTAAKSPTKNARVIFDVLF